MAGVQVEAPQLWRPAGELVDRPDESFEPGVEAEARPGPAAIEAHETERIVPVLEPGGARQLGRLGVHPLLPPRYARELLGAKHGAVVEEGTDDLDRVELGSRRSTTERPPEKQF